LGTPVQDGLFFSFFHDSLKSIFEKRMDDSILLLVKNHSIGDGMPESQDMLRINDVWASQDSIMMRIAANSDLRLPPPVVKKISNSKSPKPCGMACFPLRQGFFAP